MQALRLLSRPGEPQRVPEASMDSNIRTGLSEALTFAQFLEEFRRDFGGWSENTWRGNSGMLKRLCEEFGQHTLTEIKPRQVDGYLNRRRREGLAEATVNRYLCGLKTLFAVAKLWEYVEKSPVAEIKTIKEQGKVPEALSDEELEGLRDHCPSKLKAIVTLAADTGLRKSELQRLAWGDIDFDARTITIRRSKNKDYRVIPMTQVVHQLLSSLRKEATLGEHVIPFVDVGRGLSRASQKAGIKHVHLHMLRHNADCLIMPTRPSRGASSHCSRDLSGLL